MNLSSSGIHHKGLESHVTAKAATRTGQCFSSKPFFLEKNQTHFYFDLRPQKRMTVKVKSELYYKLLDMRKQTCQKELESVSRGLVEKVLVARWTRVCLSGEHRFFYSVSSRFYYCLRNALRIDTEFFADCVYVSGIFEHYFSQFEFDKKFGALGPWNPETDKSIQGGVANPEFRDDLIDLLIDTFDRNVLRGRPYCRIAVLPLTEAGALKRRLQEKSMHGRIIVLIPPDEYGFVPYPSLIQNYRKPVKHKPHAFLHLVVVVWCNESYLKARPIAHSAEISFKSWIYKDCRHPERVSFFEEVFNSVFPKSERQL